ncbi:hypothetical protein ACJX0J_041722, partial [Zea mays]
MDKKQKLAFYDFLRSQHQLCARTLKKSQLVYASLRKYFLLHIFIAIWLDSIYSEGIGLHTKKIYMTRWFGIVCLRIHNFASFNEGNQDIEKTIEKQFATCVRKIEGHRIKMLNFMCVDFHIQDCDVNMDIDALVGENSFTTKHFCNMLTYGVYILHQYADVPLAFPYKNYPTHPQHKDLSMHYLIFDYWALHICLDITCFGMQLFFFLGKLFFDMRTLQTVHFQAHQKFFLSYSLQEQQASNHFSFNQLIIYLHSILIGFLLAAV